MLNALELLGLGLGLVTQAGVLIGWIQKRDKEHYADRVKEMNEHENKHARIWDALNSMKFEQAKCQGKCVDREILDNQFEKFEERIDARLSVIMQQLGKLVEAWSREHSDGRGMS